MEVAADIQMSVDFLDKWKAGGPWVLTRIAPDKRKIDGATFDADSYDQLHTYLRHAEANKLNVYFHVNETQGKIREKASKDQIKTAHWLHVDVDPEPGFDIDEERKRILALLQKPPQLPKGNLITFSGGGYQMFWKLDEPVEINGLEEKWKDFERYNLQIELLLNGDSCHNVDRIMRLPGTINWPNEKKRKKGQVPAMAVVIDEEWDKTFSLREFTPAPVVDTSITSGGQMPVEVSGNVRKIKGVMPEDGELPSEVPDRIRVAIVQGHDPDQPLKGDNSRSEWLFAVCCALVRAECDDELIYSIITDDRFRISDSVLDKGNSKNVHRYATRQIQRAKEHCVDPYLEQVNGEYAVVESVGGQFRIVREWWNPAEDRREIDFLRKENFTNMWCNRFVEISGGTDKNGNPLPPKMEPVSTWWMRHPNRRTYRTIVYYPGREFPETLNLWRGFAYDALPGDCSLYLDHLRKILCKGNREWYDYLIGWMANAVQNPHTPGQVAVVIRGDQGTGKGTFAHHFGQLFGMHYAYVNRSEHVTGQFNFMLHNASLVFADECFVSGDTSHESALKALITEPRIRVEPKGVDNLETRNCVHLIMATNKDWAVSAALDDRRFFVLHTPNDHRCDLEYFKAIEAQMQAGGYQALLHYLLTYDLEGFNVRNRPKTDELLVQQDHSLKPIEAFWLDILTDGRLHSWHEGWDNRAYKDQLIDQYREASGDRRPLNKIKMSFGRWVKKVFGAETRRERGSRHTWTNSKGRDVIDADPHVWEFPSLAACRKLWDESFGDRDWPEDEDDDVPPRTNPDEAF